MIVADYPEKIWCKDHLDGWYDWAKFAVDTSHRLNGKLLISDKEGIVRCEYQFKNSKKHGTISTWSKEGKIEYEARYREGDWIQTKWRDEDGDFQLSMP